MVESNEGTFEAWFCKYIVLRKISRIPLEKSWGTVFFRPLKFGTELPFLFQVFSKSCLLNLNNNSCPYFSEFWILMGSFLSEGVVQSGLLKEWNWAADTFTIFFYRSVPVCTRSIPATTTQRLWCPATCIQPTTTTTTTISPTTSSYEPLRRTTCTTATCHRCRELHPSTTTTTSSCCSGLQQSSSPCPQWWLWSTASQVMVLKIWILTVFRQYFRTFYDISDIV